MNNKIFVLIGVVILLFVTGCITKEEQAEEDIGASVGDKCVCEHGWFVCHDSLYGDLIRGVCLENEQ
jgi:hypothetical protein